MYRGIYEFEIKAEKCNKIEEMLCEKLKAKKITLRRTSQGLYRLSFTVDNNRKIFAVKKVIEYYDGKVKGQWIFKVTSNDYAK